MDTQIIELLRSHFPNQFEAKLCEEIATFGQLLTFEDGQTIQDYGQYVKLIPLIVKGSIKVLRKDKEENEIFLYFLEAGDTCPMSFTCCMVDKKSQIKSIAEEDITIIGIPIKKMNTWMSDFKTWKNFIFISYENRLNTCMLAIDSLAFKKTDQRLIDYLSKKVEVTQSSTINCTHQEIADDLNTSRELISRLLKKMEQDGKITLGRNKISLM